MKKRERKEIAGTNKTQTRNVEDGQEATDRTQCNVSDLLAEVDVFLSSDSDEIASHKRVFLLKVADGIPTLPVLAKPTGINHIDGLTFKLSWDPWNCTEDYGIGPAEKYRVQCWEKNDPTTVLSGHATVNPKWTIKLPKPETTYKCGVSVLKTVENEVITGPIGPAIEEKTKCGAPLMTPTFNKELHMNSNSIQLTWSVPDSSDWIQCSEGLTGFIVQYWQNEFESDKNQSIINDSNQRSYVIKNLSPCTSYTFDIKATNMHSAGPSYHIKTETSSIAPESPKGFNVSSTASRQLKASWKEPSHQCGLTHYLVSYELINLDQCSDKVDNEHHDVLIETRNLDNTFYNLEPFSTYAISVTAANGNLPSDPVTRTIISDIDVPTAAPTHIQASAFSPGKVKMHWEPVPCGHRNGPIIEYEYQYAEKLNTSQTNGHTTERLSVVVDQLSQYEFRIAALTATGKGPYSEVYRPLRTQSDTIITLAIGLPFGAFVMIIVILVCVFLFRRSKKLKEGQKEANNTPSNAENTTTYMDLIKMENGEEQYMELENEIATRNQDDVLPSPPAVYESVQ
ncbi:neogenin-like [Amphiura filiformis]|uniref:neogenin-like n=1 Tax=Amphiura filiformis TaxID=82378 RepID=UPI003B20C9A8